MKRLTYDTSRLSVNRNVLILAGHVYKTLSNLQVPTLNQNIYEGGPIST